MTNQTRSRLLQSIGLITIFLSLGSSCSTTNLATPRDACYDYTLIRTFQNEKARMVKSSNERWVIVAIDINSLAPSGEICGTLPQELMQDGQLVTVSGEVRRNPDTQQRTQLSVIITNYTK